jgi:hypothetical protein
MADPAKRKSAPDNTKVFIAFLFNIFNNVMKLQYLHEHYRGELLKTQAFFKRGNEGIYNFITIGYI